ncbi:MAG TPA: NAD-dependent epimerase/dehydratase family protein, partial [Candidatus Dojkabacteria bacterium]
LNIPRLKEKGIEFVHGDIRNKEDLEIPGIDLVIECSAEPSVLAGLDGSVEYVLNTNLFGTLNCLEQARKSKADFVFLSTSRIYPYEPLNDAQINEEETRFAFSDEQKVGGLSSKGVSEEFPLYGPRSIYGSTKLASELFITEYIESFGMKGIINRFGCIAGPWQMGKVDQGVMALWVSRHIFKKNLSYIGFEGKGKQVRDFIHIDDVFDILDVQINNLNEKGNGEIFNIGGGVDVSVSLQELTKICEKVSGNKIEITSDPKDRPADLKIYVSDNSKLLNTYNWKPKKTIRDIVQDTHDWILEHKDLLVNILN